MRRFTSLVALLGLFGLSACSSVRLPSIETEDFNATLCVEGLVPIACQSLGVLSVPSGGDGLVSVVVAIAGPYLARTAKLKGCLFTAYPPVVGENGLTVTATAECRMDNVPVSEKVTVMLVPVMKKL